MMWFSYLMGADKRPPKGIVLELSNLFINSLSRRAIIAEASEG
jgi:hypothetical protein